MKKIPQDLCLIVSRENVRDEWDLDSLMKVIEKEIEARERAAVDSSVNTRKPGREPPTTSALLTNNPQVACCYCNGSHQSHLCRTVPSAEQRKQCLMRSGRCFICLRKGHRVKDCRSSLRCSSCQSRHHVSICTASRSELGMREQQPTQTAVTTSTQCKPPTTQTTRASQPPVLSMYVATRTPVLLQTAKAQVFRQGRPSSTVNTRIIFDSGSQRSYIVSRIRDLLALPTEMTERVLIKTFGSKVEKVQVCDVVNLAIKTKNGMSLVVSLLTVPMVCEPLSGQPLNLASEHFPYLAGLDLADSSSLEDNLDIGILIGADQYWKLVTGKIRQEGTGPTAVETKLGWVLYGPVPGVSHGGTSVNFVSTHVLKVECSDCDLDTTLKAFWDLDTLGIKDNVSSVYEDFIQTIDFKNGRYCVHLPWKSVHPVLSDNFELSQKRLLGRLRQDPQVLWEYDKTIKEQMSKGIVEIGEGSMVQNASKCHYLPHHAVIRKDKSTTKLRIVYDASAKTEGPSLNDCLYAGP